VIEQECWSSFAGIDWGGEHHQLCIIDDAGRRKSQLRVTHDVTGLADLDREMCRFADHLPVAIERSEGLLVEHLHRRGHLVFPVSPRIAARARERYKVASVKADRLVLELFDHRPPFFSSTPASGNTARR
jgi:Transposase